MITPFELRHIWLVRELQNASTILDPKGALLEAPTTPLRTALRGYFLRSSGIFTYVLRAPDRAATWRGFAQAKAHKSGLAWNTVGMAPALDNSEDAATIWYRLLLHLCIAAGERHVQRLFVCLPQDSPAEEIFRQASFTVYCHEQVFERSSTDVTGGKLSANMHPLQPENRWDVQRLCHRATPRLVLQAEELSDPRGDCQSLEMSSPGAQQGYALYGHNGEIQGYLQIVSGPRGSWLRLIVQPDAHDGVAEMLDHALAVLGNHPSRPLYCTVREYEEGRRVPLEERGFVLTDTYSLLVKHTTVHVREPRRKLVPALEKRAEVAPTVSHSEARTE